MTPSHISPDETLALAQYRLARLLRESTPGNPSWHVKANDLVGGHCIMPVDATPGEAGTEDERVSEIADFTSEGDAALIVALRGTAESIQELLRQELAKFDNLSPSASKPEVPPLVLAIAAALLRS